MKKNLLELEESLSYLKNYCNYDDAEYKGIRDIGNSLNQLIDEDYYKPIKTTNGFDNRNNYESKDKNLSPKNYLDMIRLHNK